MVTPALGAETFYVCAGGNGTLPETNACATAWDWDDVDNAANWAASEEDDTKIGPNDTVIWKDDGGTYNFSTDLDTFQSGSSGNVITFISESGDTPTLRRSGDVSSGWSLYSGTACVDAVYRMAADYRNGLFEDGEVLNEEGSMPNAAGEFWWSGATYTYLRTTDSCAPSSHTITYPAGSWIIEISDSYIVIDGLKFEDHNGGIWISSGADYVTVKNSTFEDMFFAGVSNDSVNGGNDNLTIENNTFTHIGMGALYAYKNSNNGTFTGNICTDGNYLEWSMTTDSVPRDGHCAAIHDSDGWTISENLMIDQRDAIVIYGTATHDASNNVIKYNMIRGGTAYKTHYEGTAYGKGITIGSDAGTDYHKDNIVMYNVIDQVNDALYVTQANSDGNGNLFYGNTVYDAEKCIRIRSGANYNYFKNNICTETDTYHVDDEGTAGTNNVFDDNQYYPNDVGFVYEGSTYTTLQNWKDATSQDGDSDPDDPGLTAPATDDFTLTAALAGETLAATYDDALDPDSTDFTTTPPTIVTIQQTGTWDKGAYPYSLGAAPTVTSVTIATNGTTVTIVFSEAITEGTGHNDADLDIDASISGNDISLTYSSGDTTNTHVYTSAQTIHTGETVNFDFNGDADSWENSEGTDVAEIVSKVVVNNSEEIATSTDTSVGIAIS